MAESAENVGDRGQAQQALRESEQLLRQLAGSLTAGLSVKDLRTRALLYLSPHLESISGRSLRSIYEDPRACLEMVHPEDRAPIEMLFARLAPGVRVEYRIIRQDGVTRWLCTRTFPIYDEQGEVYRIAGLTEDITDRKCIEDELRRHRDELDTLVQARSAQVRELERQRADDECWVMAGRMAARIAHEINNPLAGIKQAFLLVKDAVATDHPYFTHVGLIEKEIDRLAFIVRQASDLYRPVSAIGASCDAAQALRDVVLLLRASALEHQVTIDVDGDAKPLRVSVPDASLRQVLLNVVLNAIEASPPGGTVTLSLGGDGDAHITVLDQGGGIPADLHGRVFEPFFTTKSRKMQGGLGLGLSISRTILDSLGGTIVLESAPGQGTLCRIVLPR